MLDFFRDAGKSADEKRQDALSAYLDGSLGAGERQRLEADLAADPRLRAELEQFRVVQQQLRAAPRRRAPRSYALDPALYGKPKPQRAQQLYPVLRTATAFTALIFAIILGLNLIQGGFGADSEAAQPVAQVSGAAVEEAAVLEAPAPQEAAADVASMAEAAPTEAAAAMSAAAVAPGESAPDVEAAATSDRATDRAQPTATIAGTTTPEDLAAAGAVTESLAAEAPAEVSGGAAEPTFASIPTEAAAVANAATEAQAADEPAPNVKAAPSGDLLTWLAVALGVALLALLLLTAIVRRRVI